MKETSTRMNKINEELKKEIGYLIDQKVKNSKVKGIVTVTQVKTSPDLKHAKVFVSMYNTNNKKEVLAGLKAASGFIRSQLAHKINLRYTPELIFIFDESIEYGERIESILRDIMKDIKKDNSQDISEDSDEE